MLVIITLPTGPRGAGDVNGYDSLLLSTTVVRGKGRAPEIPITKSVSQMADSQTWTKKLVYRSRLLLVILRPTLSLNYVMQWVVLYNQQGASYASYHVPAHTMRWPIYTLRGHMIIHVGQWTAQ